MKGEIEGKKRGKWNSNKKKEGREKINTPYWILNTSLLKEEEYCSNVNF